MTDRSTDTTCPSCGSRGRAVGGSTLKAQLTSGSLQLGDSLDDYRFCGNGDCDVVYFSSLGSTPFERGDLKVPVFQKSSDPDRFVCYCFQHRVGEIVTEVKENGASAVPDEIKAKCKAGLDECELKNPQGVCCLGNVLSVVKQATPPVRHSHRMAGHDCCTTDRRETHRGRHAVYSEGNTDDFVRHREKELKPGVESDDAPLYDSNPGRAGLFSAGGALAAAVLSSACCWLPLALIGLGASAGGVAGFFETYRLPFFAAAAALLGVGFYYVYFRAPRCAPGDACAAPNLRLQKFNRLTLWLAAAFVMAVVTFPQYVGMLVGQPGETLASLPTEPPGTASPPLSNTHIDRTYVLEGMTCAGCSVHAQQVFESVPGVVSAAVDYSTKSARLALDRDLPDEVFRRLLEEYGYRIVSRSEGRHRSPTARRTHAESTFKDR